MGPNDERLFNALAKMAERRLDQFNAQALANIAWALAVATVGQHEEQLFKAMAKMAELRLDQFNAQELANTAWAFATVGQSGELLFAALATVVTVGQLGALLFAGLARAAVRALPSWGLRNAPRIGCGHQRRV